MARSTGQYQVISLRDEPVRAFVPFPLPPTAPELVVEARIAALLTEAEAAVRELNLAASLVPSSDWFLYGFVRKEAVLTSQVEGTQATLQDVLAFEATQQSDRPEDVREVCNYVEAITYARGQLADPAGLPLSTRLLCAVHRILMQGARGADKQPGEIRRSQNWIGGTRPGNARFVPPPPGEVGPALGALEQWIHGDDPLPPLIRAGLAHVQFETIHPFLDGNGRIGRMLVALLVEHWGLLDQPLLCLSVAIRQWQREYYNRLSAVRTEGDWEGWTEFFLDCVRIAAREGVSVARELNALRQRDRDRLLRESSATVAAIRLFELLPEHPMVTAQRVAELLRTTAPTARKAIELLVRLGILNETTGRERDRVYAYREYLQILAGDA